MTLSTLTRQLDTLGFGGFKAALERQSNDPNYAQLPFEERLYQLLEAEENERSNGSSLRPDSKTDKRHWMQ